MNVNDLIRNYNDKGGKINYDKNDGKISNGSRGEIARARTAATPKTPKRRNYGFMAFSVACFCLISISAIFMITALFTSAWLRESVQTKRVFSMEVEHGLWQICIRTWINENLVSFWDKIRFWRKKDPNSPPKNAVDRCIVRFGRDHFRTRVLPLIDRLIEFYHENLILWEILVLIMVSASVVLNLLAAGLHFPLIGRYPTLLTLLMLAATALTTGSMVTYSFYHNTRRFVRSPVTMMSLFVTESYRYGFSYFLAAGGCLFQILALLLLIAFAVISKRKQWR